MKITVSRSLLSDALRKVQSLASGKNSMPILSNVMIEANDQKAKFTTTDLDISVVVEIPCNVIATGATTLPAKLLSDAISRASEGDVSFETDESTNKAIIKAGSSIFRMVGLPADEFPRLPQPSGDEQEIVIPQEVLKSMLRRTAYAMSQDDTRRTLKGVHVKVDAAGLTCVATDGRRLAVGEYAPEEAYGVDMEFTFPAKTVLELMKNLGNTGNVAFKKCVSQITATLDSGFVVYTKLIDDAYPNYKQVIPVSNDKSILIDRPALVAAIERVGVFSEAYSMKFDFGASELKLTSSTEEGKGEETVPIKYDGETISATFNHGYILDVLKSLDDDEVQFLFSDGTRPLLIKSSAPGLAVVMPLRVS